VPNWSKQSLPALIKGFSHAVWPDRAHAALGNGPLFPRPHRKASAAHCSAEEPQGQRSLLSWHIWQALAEEWAACSCLGFVRLARESSLSSYRESITK